MTPQLAKIRRNDVEKTSFIDVIDVEMTLICDPDLQQAKTSWRKASIRCGKDVEIMSIPIFRRQNNVD